MSYKVGVFTKNSESNWIASCSCGTKETFLRDGSDNYTMQRRAERHVCKNEECGCDKFVFLVGKKRSVIPYLKLLHKSNKGFKVLRVNLSVYFDNDLNVLTKENMKQVLLYNIRDRKFMLYKNNISYDLSKMQADYNNFNSVRAVNGFFNGVCKNELIRLVSTEQTRPLLDIIYNKLSQDNKYYYSVDKKLYRGFIRFANKSYSYLEVLANAGFDNLDRFFEKDRYGRSSGINKEGTNPKDILGVPKFVLPYLREDNNMNLDDVKSINNALKKIDGNKFKELMSIVKDEGRIRDLCSALDYILTLHNDYGYNNLKKLVLYLFREIRMNQGISNPVNGANLLRDYVRMSKSLEIEYEKYPKSLKKEHDIMVMNYNVQKSEAKKKSFEQVVTSDTYKELEFKDKEFSIIPPKEMEDLIKEGSELSHCVASYVDSILEHKCKILFLRESSYIDKPLGTIEIRGGNIRQARGFANRTLSRTEKSFIEKWAFKNKLEVNYY